MPVVITEYTFSPEEIEQIKIYRDKQIDARLKSRFIALLLLSQGIAISMIVFVIGKSQRSIENWFKQYIDKGIDSLNYFQYKPKKPLLDQDQINQLIDFVSKNNPKSVKEIRDYIINEFKITYTHDAIRKLLKKNNIKFIRPKLIPGNPPSEDKQKDFIEEYRDVRQFIGHGVVILFCDAMHLIHQTVPTYCWGDPKNPPCFSTNTGRQRINIIGGYNPATRNLIHLTDEANCDSKQVIKFFELVEKYYSYAHSIILILDNAKYHYSKEVNEWLEKHPKIICWFLPPYAPNLNLIERFWGFAKENLVYNIYYPKYKTFRCNVFRFLNNTSNYDKQLKTLMVEEFQIISNNRAA